MSATLDMPQSHSMRQHSNDPLFTPKPVVGPLTEGLAQVLGQGMAATPVPGPITPPIPGPSLPNPPPMMVEIKTAAMESMRQALQQPIQESPAGAGLDTLRMQMFGRYYEELEGRMKELRQVLDGGVARARKAMLERVDELGTALHRDMVSLRQEVQKEVEDLKRDVFTTVMSVSAINDRMGMAESRNRETWMAVTKTLTDRIEMQSASCNESITSFRNSLDETLEQRVVNTVESTLMRMAASRRAAAPNDA
jgi:hypothetical protein